MNTERFFYDTSVDDFQSNFEPNILKMIKDFVSTKYQFEFLDTRTLNNIVFDVENLLHNSTYDYAISNYNVERIGYNISVKVQPFSSTSILVLNMEFV